MARNVALMAFGIVVGVLAGAAGGTHAANGEGMGGGDLTGQGTDEGPVGSSASEVEAVPSPAPQPDSAADLTVEAPAQVRDWIDRCLDALAWAESRNNPRAVNPRSGASGLLQFLPSTFRGTPQGRAGLSIWDVSVQRAAGRWMINQGRLHEWTTWRVCG